MTLPIGRGVEVRLEIGVLLPASESGQAKSAACVWPIGVRQADVLSASWLGANPNAGEHARIPSNSSNNQLQASIQSLSLPKTTPRQPPAEPRLLTLKSSLLFQTKTHGIGRYAGHLVPCINHGSVCAIGARAQVRRGDLEGQRRPPRRFRESNLRQRWKRILLLSFVAW